MKYLLMMILTILCLSTAYGEKMIEVPESELKQYLEQLVQADKRIKELIAENLQLRQDRMDLQAALAVATGDLGKQTGIYIGGAIGYPIPSGEIAALYKFKRWGLYASGGYYGKAPAVNVGIMVKAK